MYHQKRWVRAFRRQANGDETSGRGVKAISVDALALATFLGVCADIYEIFRVMFYGGSRASNWGQEKCCEGQKTATERFCHRFSLMFRVITTWSKPPLRADRKVLRPRSRNGAG